MRKVEKTTGKAQDVIKEREDGTAVPPRRAGLRESILLEKKKVRFVDM